MNSAALTANQTSLAAPSRYSTSSVDDANAIMRCQVRDHEGDDLRYRVVDVEAEYRYGGDHGINPFIRPVVTIDGAASPHFIREVQPLVSGTHTVNMQVLYGAADAPPGLQTNGLRVEMAEQNGAGFLFSECHLAKAWRRENARAIEVSALDDGRGEEEKGRPSIPVTVTLPGGHTETHLTPFTLAVTQGATLTLQAPMSRTGHESEIRKLREWYASGVGSSPGASKLNLTVAQDTAVVAAYVALDHAAYMPVISR